MSKIYQDMSQKILEQAGRKAFSQLAKNTTLPDAQPSAKSFADHMKEYISEVDEIQKKSDLMTNDVSIGKSGNLHEAMASLAQAEISFQYMVQVRNKALEAYQDIMRMPV